MFVVMIKGHVAVNCKEMPLVYEDESKAQAVADWHNKEFHYHNKGEVEAKIERVKFVPIARRY